MQTRQRASSRAGTVTDVQVEQVSGVAISSSTTLAAVRQINMSSTGSRR